MIDAQVVRRLDNGETPQGTLIMQFVIEMIKNRLRPIRNAKNFNNTFGRETLQELKVPSRTAVRCDVLRGRYAIVVDMTQWFDQLPLDKAVELFFCFDPLDGKGICCATTVPMGMRHASEVGTGTMRRLLDYKMSNEVYTKCVADGVRFIGEIDDIVAEFITFAERCSIVGAQLNEANVDDITREAKESVARGEKKDSAIARSLVTQKYTFLGENFDHTNNTMCSTKKTQEKLVLTWSRRDCWTNRQFASHLGLLYYASSTARISLAQFHSVIRHFARVCSMLQKHPECWDDPAEPLAPSLQAELKTWSEHVMRNTPVDIPLLEQQECGSIICTDASGTGWAGIHINLESGAVQTFREDWPPNHRLIGAGSPSTEPQAVKRAICRFLRPADKGVVCVLTDHSSLVDSLEKGHSKSYDYTLMLQTMSCFAAQFFIKHIPGDENPVDKASRGACDVDVATAVPTVMRLFDGAVYVPATGPFSNPLKTAALPR